MKKLTLLLLCLPSLLCADLAFPVPHQMFLDEDYINAIEYYNSILQWGENLSELDRFEAIYGRYSCAVKIVLGSKDEVDAIFKNKMSDQQRQSYLSIITKIYMLGCPSPALMPRSGHKLK